MRSISNSMPRRVNISRASSSMARARAHSARLFVRGPGAQGARSLRFHPGLCPDSQALCEAGPGVERFCIDVDGINEIKSKDMIGEEIQAKADGSLYQLVRYPDDGYRVSNSRTAGDAPLITVTIQKMQ